MRRPGGSAANLPKDITTCDGNTIQGTTILVANDGSFSDSSYQVYMLPNSVLGEQPNDKPICNQTNYCVLYVGQNQNDFTAPKVFSAPFLITPGSGSHHTTSTAAATELERRAPAGTSTTVAAGDIGGRPGSSRRGRLGHATWPASGALWLTPAPPPRLDVARRGGDVLLIAGAIGRRRALRGVPMSTVAPELRSRPGRSATTMSRST